MFVCFTSPAAASPSVAVPVANSDCTPISLACGGGSEAEGKTVVAVAVGETEAAEERRSRDPFARTANMAGIWPWMGGLARGWLHKDKEGVCNRKEEAVLKRK